jgi:two-component system cell cycle sensor histidine kinase/response regulator CckA
MSGENLEKMLRRLIDENIEMTIVPGKEIGRIKADSGYIGQVLMNLVVNARDAMPNGGKLTIATKMSRSMKAYATHPCRA